MAQLPLLKLSSLLLKTLAKPLSTRLKFEASRSPLFTKFCAFTGQHAHSISSRMNVIASGYKFLGVKPLPKEEAVDLGISYISDGVIISLGAAIIITEYQRGEAKNQAKAAKAAAKEAADKAYIESRFEGLQSRMDSLEQSLAGINERLGAQTTFSVKPDSGGAKNWWS